MNVTSISLNPVSTFLQVISTSLNNFY
jgi:hypothetical protein